MGQRYQGLSLPPRGGTGLGLKNTHGNAEQTHFRSLPNQRFPLTRGHDEGAKPLPLFGISLLTPGASERCRGFSLSGGGIGSGRC